MVSGCFRRFNPPPPEMGKTEEKLLRECIKTGQNLSFFELQKFSELLLIIKRKLLQQMVIVRTDFKIMFC